jgi:hypothetical protein
VPPSAHRHVAEILEQGMVGMLMLPVCEATTCGGLAAGEEQELLGLVAADIGQDAAIARLVPEPVGPARGPTWCGAMLIVWTTLPIAPARSARPALTAAGTSSRSEYMIANLRPVSLIAARTSASCFRVVIAGLSPDSPCPPHRPDAERRAQIGDRRAGDQLDRPVLRISASLRASFARRRTFWKSAICFGSVA